MFLPKMFQGFPEIKEALIANRMQAGFLVAPMAIALRSQGVPIKIVYLGHRYGSAFVVAKDGPVHSVRDLGGRTIAVPSRFSDQRLKGGPVRPARAVGARTTATPSRFSDERLMVGRALRANGMTESDVKMVEMAPPD